MNALDHMIDNNLTEYLCDPWMGNPQKTHFAEMRETRGQVNHRGEIFVVTHAGGSRGMGGMDEGSPPSVTITRIILHNGGGLKEFQKKARGQYAKKPNDKTVPTEGGEKTL